MACSDSRDERSRSVSSIRRMNVPPLPRANSQLKSAVRALPTWRWPVGLGAKRRRITLRLRQRAHERDGMGGHRLALAHRLLALVGLGLDAHPLRRTADGACQ